MEADIAPGDLAQIPLGTPSLPPTSVLTTMERGSTKHRILPSRRWITMRLSDARLSPKGL
ncbi:MAG: hypothetical protein DMG88_02930 [Acidobacteria bacterium]|nr:MAG: hypothetical protein DMG88_02930 [Acidobacteriota bacterium]